jgi:hypothetical protein
VAALVLPLTLALVSCGQDRVAVPTAVPDSAANNEGSLRMQAPPPGSGLVLNSLTGVTLLVGSLGDVVIDQVVITNFALVENTVGQIVGLEVTGTLQGVLAANPAVKVSEDFTSTVTVTSSGPGQCDLVTIDLGPLKIDGLGIVTADVPSASLTGRGSGAVGSLLCNLGNLLGGLLGGAIPGVGGIVNGINNLI